MYTVSLFLSLFTGALRVSVGFIYSYAQSNNVWEKDEEGARIH